MAKLTKKKRIVFALLTLFIILASAETILRLKDFSFYFNFSADLLGMPLLDLHKLRRVQNKAVDFDPYLFWKFKPNQYLDNREAYGKPVTINSHGFRGPDWQDQKPKGVYRVACLGDSTTFGWSVGDEETFPVKLQKALEESLQGSGLKVEVLNLGVTGYTSRQGRELMARYAADWKPDLVIFAFGPNDRLPALKSDREHLENRTWARGKVSVFFHRFQVYKLLKAGVIYLENRARGRSLDPATYISQLKRKVSPDEYRQNAAEVKKICDRIGADLIIVDVDFPSLPEDHVYEEVKKQADQKGAAFPAGFGSWDPEAVTRDACWELSVTCVHARPLFKEKLAIIESDKLDPARAAEIAERLGDLVEKEPWRYLMVDNGHPNGWGHELLAAEILKAIKALPRYAELRAGTRAP